MTVEIRGLEEVLAAMEERLGTRKRTAVINNALKVASPIVETAVKTAVATYRDSGATFNEVVATAPKKFQGIQKVRIGWNGPMARYALVHLNEFGYTRYGRRYSPAGMGKIQGAIDSSRLPYKWVVQIELRKGLLA